MTALFSIKPEYAEAILNGSKGYEYRKVIPRLGVSKIVIYATSPKKRIIGEVDVIGCISGTPKDVWLKTKDKAGIIKFHYDKYFSRHKRAYALQLKNPKRYELEREIDVVVPQSFCYYQLDRSQLF